MTMSGVGAFFDLEILQDSWRLLLHGAEYTLLFSLVGIPLAMAAGLLLSFLALAPAPFRQFQQWWVTIFRALPPLVLVVFLFSGLPYLGIKLSPFAVVTWTFILNLGAYFCEVFRAGMISVPSGQWEAARSTGLSAVQSMTSVVLPQAFRNVLPEIISTVIEGVKLSTVGAVVAMPELLFQARQVQNLTYNATPLIAAAMVYFLALWPFVRLLSRLENRATGALQGK